MNKHTKACLATLLMLSSIGSVFAEKVDTTRPMATGRGNPAPKTSSVLIAKQIAPDETVKLERYVVTGSVIGMKHQKKK